MKIRPDSLKPIYIQISQGIEDDILNGILEEGEVCYSQNQIAKNFRINPATAAKGINLLVEEGILYRKRGMGMYVSDGAREQIIEKRRKVFIEEFIEKLVREAEKLHITREKIAEMIDEAYGRRD